MPPGGDADDAKGWCFPGSAGWGWVLLSYSKAEGLGGCIVAAGFRQGHLDAQVKPLCHVCSLSLLSC